MEKFDLLMGGYVFKTFKMLLLSIFVFISPIKPLMAAIGLFVIADTVFGILKSRKLGIKFTSKRFTCFFKKSLIYQFLLITTFFLDFFILNEIGLLFLSVKFVTTKLIALAVIFNETKSINENLEIAYGINLFDQIKAVFKVGKQVKEGFDEMR